MIWECIFLLLHQCTSLSYLLLQLLFCGGQLLLCVPQPLFHLGDMMHHTNHLRLKTIMWTHLAHHNTVLCKHVNHVTAHFFPASSECQSPCFQHFFKFGNLTVLRSNCSNRVYTKCKKSVVSEDHGQCLFFVTRARFTAPTNTFHFKAEWVELKTLVMLSMDDYL